MWRVDVETNLEGNDRFPSETIRGVTACEPMGSWFEVITKTATYYFSAHTYARITVRTVEATDEADA